MAAALIFISAVLFAVTNQRSAGLLSLTPVMVILFGPGPNILSWRSAALCFLAGGVAGAFITRLLKFQAPTLPVEKRTAWEHGTAGGLLCAAALGIPVRGRLRLNSDTAPVPCHPVAASCFGAPWAARA